MPAMSYEYRRVRCMYHISAHVSEEQKLHDFKRHPEVHASKDTTNHLVDIYLSVEMIYDSHSPL